MTAPVASGWSGCRVGFAPTGKRRLSTAHTHSGHRQRLTGQAALSALKRFLDSEFGIHHGIGPCKRNAGPRFGCIEKDDPFPATWICHLNDFKLDGFVFHGRSSKRRHRKFLGLPRNECRLHVQPLSINIRNHRRRCRDDGKGHDCKSKSDEFQAVSVRHLVHLKTVIQSHIEPTLRYQLP
jgi:hypothetical protein